MPNIADFLVLTKENATGSVSRNGISIQEIGELRVTDTQLDRVVVQIVCEDGDYSNLKYEYFNCWKDSVLVSEVDKYKYQYYSRVEALPINGTIEFDTENIIDFTYKVISGDAEYSKGVLRNTGKNITFVQYAYRVLTKIIGLNIKQEDKMFGLLVYRGDLETAVDVENPDGMYAVYYSTLDVQQPANFKLEGDTTFNRYKDGVFYLNYHEPNSLLQFKYDNNLAPSFSITLEGYDFKDGETFVEVDESGVGSLPYYCDNCDAGSLLESDSSKFYALNHKGKTLNVRFRYRLYKYKISTVYSYTGEDINIDIQVFNSNTLLGSFTATRTADNAEENTHSITVLDVVTNKPVPDVRVDIQGLGTFYSDENGVINLGVVKKGKYTIKTYREGYYNNTDDDLINEEILFE
jgi:hypothetical protein